VAQEVLKLSDEDVTQLQKNAIDVCFLSDSDKKQLVSAM
jgi:adenosine deaminase